MKGRNGPKWALPVLGLTVFLFYFGDRVFGQETPKAAPDTRPNLPSAADQAPAIAQHTLTILLTGKGQGKVRKNPAGPSFKKGTPVTLVAIPAPHSVFGGWSGACGGSFRTCSVILSTDLTVTANFSLKTYTIHVRPPFNGVIHPYGAGKSCAWGEAEVPDYSSARLPAFRGPGGQGFAGRYKHLHLQGNHQRPRPGSDFYKTIGNALQPL